MKFYTFGDAAKPVLLLLPGTCCHWKGNFGDGKFSLRFLQKRIEKRMEEMGDYVNAFTKMLGGGRPYVTLKSCKNQFYSDLVTPLPDKLDIPGTEFHIFYALKMGKQYRARYEQHFAHPILHEQDLQHEELLACYPEQWAALVKSIAGGHS